MKKFLVVMITLVCFIGAFYFYSKSNIYTRQAVVDSIDGNMIIFVDNCGYSWEWEEEEEENPYIIGEKVTLRMDDMNTQTIFDDKILTVER